MPRKASHGWSNRQQGGFRRGGPMRHILIGDKSRKKKSDLINQNLTIAQAANIGANISSHCQKCGAKNIKTAAYILKNFPKHANDCLSQIRTVCSNTKCLGKIIVLQYTSSKTKL